MSNTNTTTDKRSNAVSSVKQDPHTLRLLRLILEGTVESAKEAASHLSALAPSAFSPAQLWDILGRLQEGLTSNAWQTRTNSALALEEVATCLPKSDQYNFLTLRPLQWTFTETEKSSLRIEKSVASHFSINDLAEENVLFDTMLKNGRLLLSTSQSRFDAMEDEMLFRLDRLNSPLSNENALNGCISSDFVSRRAKIQRCIIAKRLGLAALGDIVGNTEDLIPFEDEDVPPVSQVEINANKRQTASESILRKKQKLFDSDCDISSRSIRTLLTGEIERICFSGLGCSHSHTNPQSMLANELMYGMFHRSWQVRHGSILGICSLIRAWKNSAITQNHNDNMIDLQDVSSCDKIIYSESSFAFGAWPHDILVRCICVLLLDRFGDFSGTNMVDDEIAFATSQQSGCVVAPVREVAGQLFTLLFAMAPSRVKNQCIEVLCKMVSHQQNWEVRHGGFIVIKFMSTLLSTSVLLFGSKTTCVEPHFTHPFNVDTFLTVSIHHATLALNDDSDDVKGVAANVLSLLLRALTVVVIDEKYVNCHRDKHLQKILDTLPRHVMLSLLNTASFSSSISDLIYLASVLMDIDGLKCFITMNNMQDVDVFLRVVDLAIALLKADFMSVRLSSLQFIISYAKGLPSILYASEPVNASLQMAAKDAFFSFSTCLFELLYVNWGDVAPINGKYLENNHELKLHKLAMSCLADAAGKTLKYNESGLKLLESKLSEIYFELYLPRGVHSIENILPHHQAAEVLSQFVSSTSDDRAVSNGILKSLSIAFQSPWISQCEQACLLYRELATRFEGRCVELPCHRLSLDGAAVPLCIRLVNENNTSFADDTEFRQGFDHLFMDGCDENLGFFEKSLEAKLYESLSNQKLGSIQSIRRGKHFDVMRAETIVAGAILRTEIPAKISPVVRALITSLKNERKCKSRQHQTFTYICDLINLLQANNNYDNSLRKIMSILCDCSVEEVRNHPSTIGPGSIVLQSLISGLENDETIEKFPYLWEQLHSFVNLTEVTSQTGEDNIFLIKAIAGSFAPGKEATRHFVDEFLRPLIMYGCENLNSNIRLVARGAVEDLCNASAQHVLNLTIPTLLEYIRGKEQPSFQLFACTMLQNLVVKSGRGICPYIRDLIPTAMAVMVGTNKDCLSVANNIFAILVQFAPLIREDSGPRSCFGAADENKMKIVDHLVFGKALPQFPLPIELDKSLKAAEIKLRQYQLEGIAWLSFLRSVNLNGALCDDMGLGKTVQALVAVASCHLEKGGVRSRSLIVCPSTIVDHWQAEIDKLFPGLFHVVRFAGSTSLRTDLWENRISQSDLIITSYSVLRSEIDRLRSIDWTYCVLDEGHLLKNPRTATSEAAKALSASHKLILSGTPVQNRVEELWAVFDFLMPSFLGGYDDFVKDFANPIARMQKTEATASSIAIGMKKLKILHQKVLPFMLRREKRQVLQDLPPKNIITMHVAMSAVQAKIYDELCSRTEIRSSLDALVTANESDKLDPMELVTMNHETFNSLLLLRLVCTHPYLVIRENKANENKPLWYNHSMSGKFMALSELLQEAGFFNNETTAADNDSSLLYLGTNSVATKEDASTLFADENFESKDYYHAAQVNSKCLIFSQFSKSIDAVENFLFKKLIPSLRYIRLDGQVPLQQRQSIVDQFNSDDSIKILLLTTRVGGLGLNLTSADMVIFLEMDFNPFTDLQAMDRAHRIGQTKSVNVYRIVTTNSIEETILKIQERKLETCNAIINTDNSTMFSMGTDCLLDVFTIDNESRSPSDFDLDAITDQCSKDYMTLSTDQFSQKLFSKNSFS